MHIIRKWLPVIARVLLGLVFFVSGLNGFFEFAPLPEMPEPATSFLVALGTTGYFFPVLKSTEIACGALLLTNRFVPLSLVVLAPIMIQVALFHIFLTPGDVAMALVLVALHAYLGWAYRDSFRELLRPRATASGGAAPESTEAKRRGKDS